MSRITSLRFPPALPGKPPQQPLPKKPVGPTPPPVAPAPAAPAPIPAAPAPPRSVILDNREILRHAKLGRGHIVLRQIRHRMAEWHGTKLGFRADHGGWVHAPDNKKYCHGWLTYYSRIGGFEAIWHLSGQQGIGIPKASPPRQIQKGSRVTVAVSSEITRKGTVLPVEMHYAHRVWWVPVLLDGESRPTWHNKKAMRLIEVKVNPPKKW